jgi:Arylsulfatase regulator (Fe-S oxidoreductase)
MRLDSNIVPFTLHVRLTKACNAKCTYCSSWQEDPSQKMSVDEYKKSLEFILLMWNKNKIRVTNLSIEYVGGEILLLDISELKEMVYMARNLFKSHGISVHDGAQSNLLSSSKKVTELFNLFNGRVGTSIDSFTEQRRIGNSASKYRVFMMKRDKEIMHNGFSPTPAIFTMDNKSIEFTEQQVLMASREGRNITIRPVFKGGCNIEPVTPEQVEKALIESLNAWFMKKNIVLEPIYSLLKKILQQKFSYNQSENMEFCAFQSNCAERSMCIEPNGDLYVCQEMADAGIGILGNTINETWNDELWIKFYDRTRNLPLSCIKCEYLTVCHGGCMLKSIEDGNGLYGKSELCSTWKSLFKEIENKINSYGLINVVNWIERIEQKSKNIAISNQNIKAL